MGRNPVTWLGSPTFPNAARDALTDVQLRGNLAHATTTIRTKRAAAVAELPDWERLRRAGEAIKDDVLSNLDVYLTRLEESVTARGGVEAETIPELRDQDPVFETNLYLGLEHECGGSAPGRGIRFANVTIRAAPGEESRADSTRGR